MPRWHNRSAPHRRLHQGSRGEDVQRFQLALEKRSGKAVANDGIIGRETLKVWRRVSLELGLPAGHPITVAAQANVRWPWTRSPMAKRRARRRAMQARVTMHASDGAKVMVEKALRIALEAHSELYCVSAYRPGDPKDHGSNDWDQAARDIAYPTRDALRGPPHPHLDDAVVLIGAAFGRRYQRGVKIIDTFHWNGWRVQVIWRTSLYGGHLGHIHVGIHKL